MSEYKDIWRKAQEAMRERLGTTPRSANVSKVAAKLHRGNAAGAAATLSAIIEASAAGAAAGTRGVATAATSAANAAGGGGGSAAGSASAGSNDFFKQAKANLTKRFAKSGVAGKPKASLIHKLAALRRHGKSNTELIKNIKLDLAKLAAESAAVAANQGAAAATAKAVKINKAAKTVKKSKTTAAAQNNLMALFNVAAIPAKAKRSKTAKVEKKNSATKGERAALLMHNRTLRNYGATKSYMRPGKKYANLEAFLASGNNA